MLMMTIAWHRDLVQTGKVGFQILLHLDPNNHLFTLFKYSFAEALQRCADIWTSPPTQLFIYLLFLSSRPHIGHHLPIKVSLSKAVNYPHSFYLQP